MPDIVIRGLDMPRPIAGEAGYVDFRIFSDGTAIMASGKPPYYKMFEAVPIPEGHGRLGDLDSILKEKYIIKPGDLLAAVTVVDACYVSNAPTIVPADGGRPMTAPTSGTGDLSPTEGEGTDSSASLRMTEKEGG